MGKEREYWMDSEKTGGTYDVVSIIRRKKLILILV